MQARAFSGATWALMRGAPSMRCSHRAWPPASQMAMLTFQPLWRASDSAAAAMRRASSWLRTRMVFMVCLLGGAPPGSEDQDGAEIVDVGQGGAGDEGIAQALEEAVAVVVVQVG